MIKKREAIIGPLDSVREAKMRSLFSPSQVVWAAPEAPECFLSEFSSASYLIKAG
jgi:hypothetical protein